MDYEASVRASRDGDQFHYHWAARQCLCLLPGGGDLVAVTIEGASNQEESAGLGGDELIDVGLYYGSEKLSDARMIRYIQLKHSTVRTGQAWTASGLEQTVCGFAKRFRDIRGTCPLDDVARRIRFEFVTNRPIASEVMEAIEKLATGSPPRKKSPQMALATFSGLSGEDLEHFFALFSVKGDEGDLWTQRNLLSHDISAYLPGSDADGPVQLKELVTRKATSEFKHNPSIQVHDVLRALKATEDDLTPAPCLISNADSSIPREQEQEILSALLTSSPLVVHADAGIGKSVIAARLKAIVTATPGSEAVLYDCFGEGMYRTEGGRRDRHRDALVQIANELAARGLCSPIVPTPHADPRDYMRAFIGRLKQAIQLMRSRNAGACLHLIIDAADNAEMAAEEFGDSRGFVRDLIRTELPDGVRVVLTSRTHRVDDRLQPPPSVRRLQLNPFSLAESARHLRGAFPAATEAETAEFAWLTSSNPRVQALALSTKGSLHDVLSRLGPAPTTIEGLFNELLDRSLSELRGQATPIEGEQIQLICQGLAVLGPPVPVAILARVSGTPAGAIRSFAAELQRPLIVKNDRLYFRDEPSETWFRGRFLPDPSAMGLFLGRLRPLANESSYAAAVLPHLLLQAGQLKELVDLALSSDHLPGTNPLERRTVEMQRLLFALKACLREGNHVAAAKLSLRAAGERAGEQRQNRLVQANTDIAAVLLPPNRIEHLVAQRTFSSAWQGSRHAYDAGLQSGREEHEAAASSSLRMAKAWLTSWTRLPKTERHEQMVANADIVELTIAALRLRGPTEAAHFLAGWKPRAVTFDAARGVARRLIDVSQTNLLQALTVASQDDHWVLLGFAVELRHACLSMEAEPLARLVAKLSREAPIPERDTFNRRWEILDAVVATVDLALAALPRNAKRWRRILQKYLPKSSPHEFVSHFYLDCMPLLRGYALEAQLTGKQVTLSDLAPPNVRTDLARGRSMYREETSSFLKHTEPLLHWCQLSAKLACTLEEQDLEARLEEAFRRTTESLSHHYVRTPEVLEVVALEWMRILRSLGSVSDGALATYRSRLLTENSPLRADALARIARTAARGLELTRSGGHPPKGENGVHGEAEAWPSEVHRRVQESSRRPGAEAGSLCVASRA